MSLRPFHLAFPVDNVDAARKFWGETLGCPEGRSSDEWIDFDLYGHQIVAHLAPGAVAAPRLAGRPAARDELPANGGQAQAANAVDGHEVPVPHFGIVLAMDQWQALADRLTAAGGEFEIAPYVRFAGQAGEQATMFFRDPAGNAIEMKAFADLGQLFAKD